MLRSAFYSVVHCCLLLLSLPNARVSIYYIEKCNDLKKHTLHVEVMYTYYCPCDLDINANNIVQYAM